MRHPFWLINSLLFVLVLLALGFVIISRPKVPMRVRLAPEQEIRLPKKTGTKVDVSIIYNNDLFGTYKEALPPVKEPDLVTTMPLPPMPNPVRVPIAVPPKFLDPLNISLKGIIIVSEESENIAIIEDSRTRQTTNYKINDKLEDAQLIKITKNKIILVRSNGQQETVYVNQHDAELDQMLSAKTEWGDIIKKSGDGAYIIDPVGFLSHVTNLGQFIDILNLTTVYQKGQSIGCRVGKIEQKSLGIALGLVDGDIIKEINGIPATTTENRYKIYEQIAQADPGYALTVDLMRNNQPMTIRYSLQTLQDAAMNQKSQEIPGIQEKSAHQIQQEKIKLLKEHEKFAPTIQELRKQEKKDLVHNGAKRERRNQNMLFNTVTK